MKTALIVNKVVLDKRKNLAGICSLARNAAGQGAKLILFPETATTGLIDTDNPKHDLPLGEEIPKGPTLKRLSNLCKELSIYIGIGILELDDNRLYDTAILIDTNGLPILRYRRISKGWRTSGADPYFSIEQWGL